MSAFSSVDDSADPAWLVRYLDEVAGGLGGMKHYMAAAQARRRPVGPILDVGCGTGRDLEILAGFGITGIGVDPSAVMLAAAAGRRCGILVRADGARLPFAEQVFAGCRMERVLMHVVDPRAVVSEVVRCVSPGGLLTLSEPDWSTLRVNGAPLPDGWVTMARHPDIGGALGELLECLGCELHDRVEERSWWSYDTFARLTNIETLLQRAVARGLASESTAREWLAEQRRRAEAGVFRAEIAKILWVASAPN